jgi:hypothetical protein
VREAKADLDAHQYRTLDRNGADSLDIARAIDRIREAERVLRQAYEKDAA